MSDRPALTEPEEIEITPEMIEAGEAACLRIGYYDETECMAVEVFKAMYAVMHRDRDKENLNN